MAKVLPGLTLVVIAALCISQAVAVLDTGERDAMVAIRTHISELKDTWSDLALAATCKTLTSSTPYVTCTEGHVSGLYANDHLQFP